MEYDGLSLRWGDPPLFPDTGDPIGHRIMHGWRLVGGGVINTTCGARESSKAITANNRRNQPGSTTRRGCMLTSCHDDRCGVLCVIVAFVVVVVV